MLAMLSFASPGWLWPATALTLISAVVVWRAYRLADAATRIRLIARSLKTIAVVLLAACLIEPVWSGVQPKPHANLFVLLADNSQSLTALTSTEVNAAGDTSSIADSIRQLLTPTKDVNWLKRLEQDFGLQQFLFDGRLRQMSDVGQLDFQGEQSALNRAMQGLVQRFRDRPVGGVLLVSDGQATDLMLSAVAAEAAHWKSLGPCFPVVFADHPPLCDVSLDSVSVSESSFEDAPVTVQCDVRSSGFDELPIANIIPSASEEDASGLSVACRVLDLDGTVVSEQSAPFTTHTNPTAFRFQLRPAKSGLTFYRVVAVVENGTEAQPESQPKDQRQQAGMDSSAIREATFANNSRLIQVHRGSRQHRILYVSGRPNWEFKFLRRAIEDDEFVDLVGMIRIAKREAKFDFRGRDGQSSNSLFRGFKSDSDEETERYDEPVIVRMNTKTPDELRAGFPKEAKELFPFDAVILDDTEAEFLTRDQQSLLNRFVSERGGGLLMLGGVESFATGGYERTPIGDTLPVYLDRAQFPGDGVELKLDLTREGWLQPWARLRGTESEERQRLAAMPGFKTLNPGRGVKPGASIIATVSDSSGRHWPAVVTQQFGRGHTAAVLIGDLWRWQLRQPDGASDDLAKAWRQLLRWLVADVPQRIQVQTELAPDVSVDGLRIRIRVLDEEYRALDNARAEVRVAAAESSELITLTAEPDVDEPGVYSAIFVPRASGAWSLSASAIDGDGQDIPPSEAGWIHEPLRDELHSTGVNRPLLEKLAETTGGRIVNAEEIGDFVAGLQSQPMPVMEAWTMPLWDHPLVFAVVLACLIGEWSLRRLHGLA